MRQIIDMMTYTKQDLAMGRFDNAEKNQHQIWLMSLTLSSSDNKWIARSKHIKDLFTNFVVPYSRNNFAEICHE